MIAQLNKTSLYNTFGVQDFKCLEETMNDMAPSLVEYYLSGLCNNDEDTYLNKRDIEQTLHIGEYNIYLDYDENIFLELNTDFNNDTYETESLW